MAFFSTLGSMLGNRLMNSYQNSAIPGAINMGQGLLAQLQKGPEAMGPVPQDQMPTLRPEDVNYQIPQTQQQRQRSGLGMSAASAPALQSMGAGPVGGGGVRYVGGIPVILRSYGEPSTSLLQYLED